MEDTTQKMLVTLGAGVAKKGLIALGATLATDGIINSNETQTFVAVGMAGVGVAWSLWNDYGKAIVLSQLEVLKAKSLAQAAKLNEVGLPPVTVGQIAAQSPALTPEGVAKVVAKLPPEIQANVKRVAGQALVLFMMLSATLAVSIAGAHAQVRPRAPRVTEEAGGTAAPAGDIASSYQVGRSHLLRLPNPLKLPDPLCLTDHPGDNCPENTAKGGGVNLTGDPGKDLADFLKRGGIVLVRDMKRADQYLSAPSNPACTGTGCTKVDLLGSSCLEAIIPVAEMVVNGPQPPASTATSSTSTSTTPAAASTSATPAGSSSTWPPTVAGAGGTLLSTISPPVGMADEGIITQLAKQAIVFDALNSPTLMQGCGGFIQDKVKSAPSLAAGIMQFVTTLGIAGA